jgi:hypothetical protein
MNAYPRQPWTVKSVGKDIELITPEELRYLPLGTSLRCIDGSLVIVGVDYIDDDTRGGFLAFGVEV